MKAKSILKMLSTVVTTGMVAAAMALPTLAAGSNYTPIAAQDATFTKYLLLEDDMQVPSLTFQYEVITDEVSEILPGDSSHLPLYIGKTFTTTAATPETYPKIEDVSFGSTDGAESSTLLTGYDTYKKTITVDFGDATGNDVVKFDEPGVYRYYIKEVKSTTAGLYYDVDVDATKLRTDGDLYRTLDVYVEDATANGQKNLKVTGYIMYDGKITGAPAASDAAQAGNTAIVATKAIEVNANPTSGVQGAEKTDNFVNFYDAFSLTFGKEVTGNQGSKDKYFKMTLSLTAPVDVTFTVDIANADATVPSNSATDSTYVGLTNPTSITATKGTAVTTDFYLQDGQYIIVKGIPAGTTYALTEAEEGYKKTEKISADLSSISWDTTNDTPSVVFDALNDAVSGTITDADIHTGYTNAKDGILPTGVLVKATPVIVISVLAIAGVVFFAVRNAKNKDLDDEAETAEE